MRDKDFTEQRTGKLIRIPEGVMAFVPNPLPPATLVPTWELARLNSEADRALSELAGLARILPNAHLLSGSFRRREAVLSSRIEGTFTTMSELFLFEAGGASANDRSEVREVWNYVDALDHGLKQLEKLPICNRLIKDVHSKLMTGVRGGDKTPGEFRTRQNYIGSNPRTRIENASYVPPPPSEMLVCMSQLEDFINGRSDLPPLIREALVHYQFEAIHPFQDGNGRVGRLLLTLSLCAEKIVDHPLLYISEYIEKRKDEYYGLLFEVSAQGAWLPWLEFFLRAVAEQAKDAQSRAKKLHDLMLDHRQRLVAIKAPATTFRILDELFFIPVITTVQATKLVGGQGKTGRRAVERMYKAGILKEFNPVGRTRKRNKFHLAEEIYQLVSD